MQTTIRIQHLAGLTESHRRKRFGEYLEADPLNQFQASYANLLEPPGALKAWEPRTPGLHVVQNGSSTEPWPSG